jgi:competence protein ComEC
MLVDCGPNKKVLSEIGRALPAYVRTIDYLIVTHPDLDHYGGCAEVLSRYEVRQIFTNGRTKPSDPAWQAFEESVVNEGKKTKTLSSPARWRIGDSRLYFLSPDTSLSMILPSDDSNNFSIVFRLEHHNGSFLFTADMEVPLEQAILKKYCPVATWSCLALKSKTLKVGHHGSNSSSGEDFLRAVGPATAIISSGKKNRYGHPSLRVVRRLQKWGIAILRTDEGNAILLP